MAFTAMDTAFIGRLADLRRRHLTGFDALLLPVDAVIQDRSGLLFRLAQDIPVMPVVTRRTLLECEAVIESFAPPIFIDMDVHDVAVAVELGLAGYVVLPGYLDAVFGSDGLRLEVVRGLDEVETELLKLLPTGASNITLAGRIGRSEATTKSMLRQLFRKLAFQNRTQAALFVKRCEAFF